MGQPQRVAGGEGSEESVMEPTWHPDGSLYFVSDHAEGWWNIFKVRAWCGCFCLVVRLSSSH